MENNRFNKLFIGFLLCFLSFGVFAEGSQVDKMCKPILEKSCATNDCGSVNSDEVLQGLFNKCQASVIDLDNLKSNTNMQQVNSDVGYLVSYSNLISRALSGKDNYARVKKDYLELSKEYFKYLKINQVEFLSSLDFLNDAEQNKVLKKRVLDESNASLLKIKERTDKLDFMLKSEEDLQKYKATHTKFVPAIIFEANTAKFKDKIFTDYECKFLDMNFDKEELAEFKTRLNYKCEKL